MLDKQNIYLTEALVAEAGALFGKKVAGLSCYGQKQQCPEQRAAKVSPQCHCGAKLHYLFVHSRVK